MHDQGICRGDVEPRFNNACGKQDFIFSVIKGGDFVFQFTGAHAAVGADDADFRHHFLELFLYSRQISDTGTDIKCLSAAKMLTQDGLAQEDGIEG